MKFFALCLICFFDWGQISQGKFKDAYWNEMKGTFTGVDLGRGGASHPSLPPLLLEKQKNKMIEKDCESVSQY